jgi:hypothetical protein
MSQREGLARSFERFQDDIDAVVDKLGWSNSPSSAISPGLWSPSGTPAGGPNA